jgi:hypothetical protein
VQGVAPYSVSVLRADHQKRGAIQRLEQSTMRCKRELGVKHNPNRLALWRRRRARQQFRVIGARRAHANQHRVM